MLAELSEFTKVQSLKTDNTNYTVGKTIKFWHLDERNWLQGRIKEITQCEGYFVNVDISYQNYNKQRQIQIYREDWLAHN
ncbi:hypothetical protein [aff. Roholtiella sp. LEGE 12411]|uniref:hypothetical protein n=1 Tax=aff. Roholtiella sp. LEGE 12411 TaxID=1828822 RepID=UPI0018818C69|nr:hypothetical protein [aff. Roholtiella sp. LEGE 12411]MBE9037610.1 hypothetical protein [aff. Roholtiella sp. LEGE 12411]